MTVPEQIPVVNYVADGIVKKFDVPFEYDQQSDLHVYVDGVEPTIDKYFFADNSFNFYIAPTIGQGVKIKRITPKERDTDYNLHTNTVRPNALNTDFDRLWYVLQEVFSDVGGLSQAVQDEIIARIQGDEDLLNQLTAEISARMLGDEAVTEDLKNYVNNMIALIIGDPSFNGINADKVNDASGETQQQVNYNGGSKWHSRVSGYNRNEHAVLTNGDIVKSTIDGNTNDPNVDMTGWTNPKAVQDEINQTLQAETLYSTYPFDTIQEAVDSSPVGNSIHLELKHYSENIDLNKNNLIGRGYDSVINVSNNSYGVKSLQTLPNWDRMRISDIAFKGVSRVGTVGFQFDPSDPFAGRRNIEYCTFDNLDIAIHKPKGNIGNTYSNISVSNSNYGYKAKSSESPLMHAGNDRFVDAQFNGIDKWAIDLENASGSDGFGQFVVEGNSIFQFCAGGGIRLDMGNVVPICPPVIKNAWFEEIAPPNTTVNRDGVDEAPREIKLINCPIVFVEGCYLKNIELINSTMITKGCRIDSAATTYNIIAKDATSQIFADDVYMDGTISTNVTVRSVAKQKRTTSGGDLTFLSTQIRSVTKRPSNALECIGYTFRDGIVGTTTWSITGSQTVAATCVSDGGEAVAKLPMQVGITNVVGSFGVHAGKWIVWGFSVKPLGLLTGTFKFKNDQDVGHITMIANQWTHNLGIAKVATTGYIAGWLEPTSSGDLLIKDYFCAEFEHEIDALNFVNSRMSIDNP